MSFQKGNKLSNGRPKGALNKPKVVNKLDEMLAANPACNPFKTMAALVLSSDPSISLAASKELAKYMAPQLKSVEVSAQIEGSVVIGAMVPHFNGPQPPTEKLVDESAISFL